MKLQESRRTIKVHPALLLWLVGLVLCLPALVRADALDRSAPIPLELGDVSDAYTLDTRVGSLAYVPGRGLRVAGTGLVLGGYSSIDFVRDEGDAARLNLQDLSLFIMLRAFERVSLFSELEGEDLFSVDSDGDAGSPDARFEVERLYADIGIADWLGLRVGKFLTPVGRWNVIHAQPLVWTTSRPLVTEVPFDENTTGLMLSGDVLAGCLAYDVFGQFTDQFEPTSQVAPAERSGGGRLNWAATPALSIGGTYLAFRSAGEWFHLAGADAVWRRGPFEWMSEVEFDEGERTGGGQWGLYSQLVAEVLPRIYAVGRYEYFSPRGARRHLNQVVVGAAYRLRPSAVFKVEYQFADRSSDLAEPGFRSSFALLF